METKRIYSEPTTTVINVMTERLLGDGSPYYPGDNTGVATPPNPGTDE